MGVIHPNIGRIFLDKRCGAAYAVGKRGFLSMTSGDFIEYDSAFNGPEYFNQEPFIYVENEAVESLFRSMT